MNEIAIDVAGLTKSFGDRTVVRDLSMRVPKGQIFGFLGPNGSGKTTTIRLLCGLLTPDSGEGTCLGYDIRHDQDAIKRHVGYMTQRFSHLHRPFHPGEPGVCGAGLRHARSTRGREGSDRPVGAFGPRGPTCRRALRRLEAAARAWRLYPAEPPIALT